MSTWTASPTMPEEKAKVVLLKEYIKSNNESEDKHCRVNGRPDGRWTTASLTPNAALGP